MSRRIAAHDWGSTPLGPAETWPDELRTVLDLMLPHGFPMILLWGPDLVQIYNDGYREIMAGKHPAGLGRPTREVWPEVWDFNAPIYERVLKGETVTLTDQLFPVKRRDYAENIWITLCYSPVRSAEGGVAGVFVTLFETTARVVKDTVRTQREQRYRALFESIDEGFNLGEVIRDPAGRAIDILYLDENAAAVRMIGRSVKDRRLSELDPGFESDWFEVTDRVARTGRPERLQRYARPVDRWFDVYLFKPPGAGDREFIAVFRDITERKRAEEALRESETRWRGIFESMQEGFATCEIVYGEDGRAIDFRYLDVNAAWERLTGVAPETVVGRLASEAFPGIEPFWTQTYARVVETSTPVRFEYRLGPVDRWFDVYAYRIQPGRFAALFLNITDRKRGEEEQRRSEERFRLIVENARDYAIIITDPDGRITDWLPGAVAVFGWTVEEAVGQPASLIFTHEDRAGGKVEEERKTVARQGLAADLRWHRRKDGARVFIEGSMTALRDPAGELQGFLKIGQDVTERHRAEGRLQESERRFRGLVEGVPQLVWRSRGQGGWTWASPQWTSFTGLSQEESLGHGWLAAVHPDDRASVTAAWSQAEARGMLDVETRIMRASDERYFWHQTRAVPVRDDWGHILEWLGTATDVQDLKNLQDRQSVLVAELQHRTRNLLSVVRSVANQTMVGSGSPTAFRTKFSDRLNALSRVEGLLSRSGEEPIAIGDLVRMELDALGAAASDERIAMEGPKVTLRKSVVQTLALALHELATNARKYGALTSGEGRLVIRWSIRGMDGEDRWLCLEWTETGIRREREEQSPMRVGGYGRQLIEKALPYSLGARTTYDLRETDLACTIALPLADGREETP